MKKIVLLCFVIVCYASSKAQVWTQQASGFSVTGEYPFAIHVCDSNVAWCVAYRGDGTDMSTQEFSVTTNGGNSWQSSVVTIDTNYRFAGVWAYDADTA